MVSESQHAKAAAPRSLHEDGIFVLPNAWDAGSAAMIAAAGAPVIATTSAGVSWSLGRQDGQRLSRPEATDAVRRIADAVDVPVTAGAGLPELVINARTDVFLFEIGEPAGRLGTCWPAPPPTRRPTRTACSCPGCSTSASWPP